tara:strand:+ start:3142 stop:3375 length:234 start_codon:yes stop_codon:yes gene_type:complete
MGSKIPNKTLLQGQTMPGDAQWKTAARVLAIRDILIAAGITTVEEFDEKTEKILKKINKKREATVQSKRKRYGFGKA